MTDVLTNPAWHALIGAHKSHAEAHGAARRYHPDISVFYAIGEPTTHAWDDAAHLATDGIAVLLREAPLPQPPDGWRTVFSGEGYQMVRPTPSPSMPPLPSTDPATGQRVSLRDLATADIDSMVDLVTRTEPGPFRPGTIELGGYIGIFHDDTLVAMAGRRFRPPGYCEVSAVCTDPSARRRGYASIVTAKVADAIAAEGDTPMLHVADDNHSARAAYEQLGFEVSRKCGFAAMRPPRRPG
jgi:ribosomal protein S18 acetylase RimI-like enzyme